MDSVTTYFKEQPVVHLLKDYCYTPRSFEQIEYFLAQDCSFDPDKMRERIALVLRLIDKQFLVTSQGDKWRFSIPEAGWAALYGDDDQDERTPVTLEQFRKFLKFVAVFYGVAQSQLSYSALESVVPPQGKIKPIASDYSLVKQVQLDTSYQMSGLALRGIGKTLSAHIIVYERDFVRLNMELVNRTEDNHFLLGWPLLVTGQGDKRCYTPIFYFALTKAQIDVSEAISSPQVIGPFYNAEAFSSKALALYADKSYGKKLIAGFEWRVTNSLKELNDALATIEDLNALVRHFFGEHCYGSELAFTSFSSLVSLSELEQCDNQIAMAATLALTQPSNFYKNTVQDLKCIANASEDELRRSALSCFFYDERSAQLRTQNAAAPTPTAQAMGTTGFNPFAQNSRAAIVFNFDPNCPCDEDQTRAVRSMLKNDLTVLQGPPGTGKTMTIVSAAYNHLVRGQKVLVTSYNNAAIDAFNDKSLLKVGSGEDTKTYRLAKLLKEPETSSALTFKQLAKEIVKRPKILTEQDFAAFRIFTDKVQAQEHNIAQLEQLKENYEFQLNLMQTQVDELAQSFIFRYAPQFPQMPASMRSFFDELFVLNLDALDQKLDAKQFEQYRNQSLTFNVRFSSNAAEQEAFKQKLDKIRSQVNHFKLNHPDDSDTLQQQGAVARWKLRLFPKTILRYCDHQLLNKLIDAVQALSEFKAELVQRKAQYGLAHPNQLTLDELGLEQTIAHLALSATESNAKTTVPLKVSSVDNSVVSVLTKLSTLLPSPNAKGQPPEYATYDALDLSNIVKMTDAEEHLKRKTDLILKVFPACTVSLLSVGTSLPCQSAMFDLVIFDEAAQFNFIAALPVLFRAKRAAIIGDPEQLQPVGGYAQSAIDQMAFVFNLSNKLRIRFGLNDTLYTFAKRCYAYHQQEGHGHGALTELILRQNRRSAASIVAYISHSFYHNQLAASRKIDKQQLRNEHKLLRSYDLGFNFEQVLDSVHEKRNSSRFYPQEVTRTVEVLLSLAQEQYQGTIGIIAPYRPHIEELKYQVGTHPELKQFNYEIDTVHRFQGKDCDTIIYNLCLDYSAQREFATEPHLINVALSRARDYLIVVGNPNALLMRSHIPYLAAIPHQHSNWELDDRAQALMLAQAQLASFAEHQARFDTKWERALYLALKQGMEQDPFFGSKQIGFYTQLPILHYRLDLALIYQDVGLDIECDGSQHYVYWIDAEHYRVVSSDQERAHKLSQHRPITFDTIRFSNLLIDQDPIACAQQVITRFKQLVAQRDHV